MGLFTSKVVVWRRRIHNGNAGRVAYRQLAATIGEPQARKFLEIVYDKWVQGNRNEPIYGLEHLPPADGALSMRHELGTYRNRMEYVNSRKKLTRIGFACEM